MPSTTPWGIWFPDDTSPVSPLESLFSQLATSINTMATTIRSTVANTVANAAARDALYPNPVSLDRVWRGDRFFEEFYAPSIGWVPTIARPWLLMTGFWSLTSSAAFVLLGATASYPYSEVSDRNAWRDPSVNPTRITPDIQGFYKITVSMTWGGNGSDQRILQIRKNGSIAATSRESSPISSALAGVTVSYTVVMNGSTDYFDILEFQNSGSTLTGIANVVVEYMGP